MHVAKAQTQTSNKVQTTGGSANRLANMMWSVPFPPLGSMSSVARTAWPYRVLCCVCTAWHELNACLKQPATCLAAAACPVQHLHNIGRQFSTLLM